MADLLTRCTDALNESGDWLQVETPTVDLLVYAICAEGYTVRIAADQWFGLTARSPGTESVSVTVDADRIIDGLAAIYLHLREP